MGEVQSQTSFFPDEEIGETRELKDWIKPEKWFYRQIEDGKITKDTTHLHKGWYLADFAIGEDYTDGTQEFKD